MTDLGAAALPSSVQPPPIQAFIDSVLKVPLTEISKPLQGFAWVFDKVNIYLTAKQVTALAAQIASCMSCIHTVPHHGMRRGISRNGWPCLIALMSSSNSRSSAQFHCCEH